MAWFFFQSTIVLRNSSIPIPPQQLITFRPLKNAPFSTKSRTPSQYRETCPPVFGQGFFAPLCWFFDNSLDRLMLEAGRWSLEAGSYFAKRTQFQLAENRKIAPKSPKSRNSKYEKIPNEPNFLTPHSRPICPPKTPCFRAE